MSEAVNVHALGIQAVKCVIASGQSLSGELDLEGYEFIGIEMDPAGWDAAAITFQAAEKQAIKGNTSPPQASDLGTFQPVFDDSATEVSIAAPVAARCIVFGATLKDKIKHLRHIKVRSGTNGAPVNQTATRTLWLLRKQGG